MSTENHMKLTSTENQQEDNINRKSSMFMSICSYHNVQNSKEKNVDGKY